MNFSIETFSSYDQRVNEVESFRNEILKYDEHSLIENYSHENLDFSKQLGITLGKEDGKCIYFSTIFRNKQIYGNNSARLISRFYVRKEYRSIFKRDTFKFAFKKNKLNDHSFFNNSLFFNNNDSLVDQQIRFVKSYYPEIDYVFLSREHPSANILKNYVKLIFEKMGTEWTFEDNLVLVCDASHKKACWQHVIYYNITENGNFQILNNKINIDQYKLLED